MPGFIYKPNPLATIELAKSAGVREALRAAAERIAAGAKAVAPVDTGAYRDSIRVEETAEGAQVVAGDDVVGYALYVEYGTSDTPAFAPLRRGLDSA